MEEHICCPTEAWKQIYKNMKMGADSLLDIMGKVKDETLRVTLTKHMEGYLSFAENAKSHVKEASEEAKEENILTRMAAKMGMAMNTVVDSTTSHLAEMVIEGSTMGVTEMTKILNSIERTESEEKDFSEAKTVLKEIIAFEEKNIARMKAHL